MRCRRAVVTVHAYDHIQAASWGIPFVQSVQVRAFSQDSPDQPCKEVLACFMQTTEVSCAQLLHQTYSRIFCGSVRRTAFHV